MKAAFVLQLFSTFAMTGLIWFVQVVHYPLFDGVGTEGFAAYEERHRRLTTWVVLPLMTIELATAALWLWTTPSNLRPSAAWAGFALVAIIWLSTFFLQVPAHAELARGFLSAPHRTLVATNWIRTAAWTTRSVLLGAILWQRLR